MRTGQVLSKLFNRTRLNRAVIAAGLGLAMAFNPVTAAPAQAAPQRASLVIDFNTGQTLSQSNAHKTVHPASLTKIMTLLMVFDALRDGRLTAGQDLTVSAHAASMVPVKLGLKAGSTIPLEVAMKLAATRSTNDLAVVLAEAVSGTEADFAIAMTAKAQAIGMDNTLFKNASGLPNPAQVTTAWDMALLARHLIADYEAEYNEFFGLRSVRYNGQTYATTNRLMLRYPGMDGVKTGYINASGFNLVASAERNNRRIIGVVFGGASARSRDNEMARLLDNGFKTKPVPIPTPRPDFTPTNDNKPREESQALHITGRTYGFPYLPKPNQMS
ncbi:MAG: D-alanyl-D-alanine carboxypeptidase [Alphaproteobacteria bacterium]|nr:D-alanyl-D-alanine carboxypeptidase [Alphaproteobacteria bacterium]